MPRIVAGSLAAIALAVIALHLAAPESTQAQDRTEQRLDALETQVANLSTRVAALEPTTVAAKASRSDAYSGSGPDALTLHLAAGTYKLTAHASGTFFYVIVRDAGGAIISENLAFNDPVTHGATTIAIAATGDYRAEVGADGDWRVTIARV